VKPYYEHAGITIYHGDCRDVLPLLEAVDLVLTDPPYGVSYVSSHRTKRTDVAHPIPNDHSLECLQQALALTGPLLKDDRHAYWFASLDETLGEACGLVPCGWQVRRVLVWDKENWGMGDLECDYGQQCEAVIHAAKGRRALTAPRPSSLIRLFGRGSGSTWDHPTQKPVALMRFLIDKSTLPGELVLDPFMGSGTTLRAAKDLGRRAIGIEIEERYCEIAANRLRQEVLV
jgi:site-specific DNA-methyltransferase (adenine-specific)